MIQESEPTSAVRRTTLVLGLGTAQLLAWGTSYYAIAVLGQPMRRDLGLSDSELFGIFAWSLALSGLLAPWAGKLVDRVGGRSVLAASSVIGMSGFGLLAVARSRIGFGVSWTLLGLTMALGLYDTCFAALAQAAPLHYRKSVTGVTLLGGLASTAAWPVSHYLLHAIGWRSTCLVYAGSQLACAALYLSVLPRAAAPAHHATRVAGAVPAPVEVRNAARLLALAFAGTAFVAGAFSAHLIHTLTALHITEERAVWVASSVGVMQVLGRLVEGVSGQRHSALRVGFVTFGLMAAATCVLPGVAVLPWLVFPFVVLYGTANGLITVAKAAIPVELLGFEGVGATLGTFSAPSLLMRAFAPFGFALLMDHAGMRVGLAALCAIGALSLGAFVYAARVRPRAQRA